MLELETNATQMAIRYRDANKVVAKNLHATLRRVGLMVQRHIVREKLRGQALNARTGTLARAIFYLVEVFQSIAQVRIGVDTAKAKYGPIHELGGVITPKRAQNLTIPLGPALTRNGVARLSAREFLDNPGILGFEHAFFNRRGTAIMGVHTNGSLEPVFALKKSVTIKPTGYMRGALRDKRAAINEEFGVAAADIAGELGGTQ